MKKVRVRYAPSPTGFLHIGGARSALYNYLYAKHNGGDFILRIEDTDIERNVVGGEDSQLDGLLWLNIVPDESPRNPNPKYAPYRQTEKLDIYKTYAEELVRNKCAYYCYCSEEELEKEREKQNKKGIIAPKYNEHCLHLTKAQITKYQKEGRKPCIRLHLEAHKEIVFNDLIRGEVKFNNDDIGDWVILKSNGIPTYNFAVVIDDHLMDITHVLRGEEHLSNTPKQIQIYQYFNWDIPVFGHMTLITNEEGKKLSKRDPNIIQFIQQYRDMGYLPQAIFNFLLLLGWSSGSEKEIFSHNEAIEVFDANRLSKAPTMFDTAKLKWINNYYIKQLSKEEVQALCLPYLQKEYSKYNRDDNFYRNIIDLYHEQLSYGQEIVSLVKQFFVFDPEYSEEAKQLIQTESAKTLFAYFKDRLEHNEYIVSEDYKGLLKEIQKSTGIKGKELYMPLRLKIFGSEHGPDLVTSLAVLGQKEILTRLKSK